ncbi:MAG: enoyl-CoA hydratase-related protein, partial [Bdellovibrionaceae bacterium]|nr:enoyl-CoA hydratase-related protein [Pseudobdellovibrionaceae bacterium]
MSPVMLSSEGPIWTLTIHRPEALNALNSAVLNDLAEALDKINSMSPLEARALIITGSGEKAFVAGADIKEIAALDEKKALEFAKLGQRVLQRISTMKVPVVAAVNGFALGGGCELALACDYIYASQNAKFGLPEVSLGLIPGFGGTVNLSLIHI